MREIEEPSRLTPVFAETDVLVVGSGPGGLAAAVSSARAGVATMLVERYGCLGGNLTMSGLRASPGTARRRLKMSRNSGSRQEIDNLLIVGRSVAGDKISHAAVRNMMCCTVTGQGAGSAAAFR
jgi:hypothetical protein